MARIKYAPLVDPLLNKHFGFTFQPNHYGQSMFPASKSARFRRPRQHNRQQNNQKAVTQWRNMTPETKAAWNLFASTYVQSTKRGVGIYLTGYQLFIKRNSYCFLNHGITSEFMLEPAMEAIEAGTTIFTLEAGDNSIDLTELYISNFGILPNVGQTLLFCAIPYSDVSGQFFAPIFDILTVVVIFVDGFFLNLTIPPQSNNILYSVYLSKPVSAGMSYVGTKVRYMGCFTTKKFTALSDVPAVTPADSGKVWSVNPDGTWGVNDGGGGGGLTCETLSACPTIQQILSAIATLAESIIESTGQSIPPINFGCLYNSYAMFNAAGFTSSDEWTVITYAQAQLIVAHYGGTGTSGGPLKIVDLAFWNEPNTGATNVSGFNLKGSGLRSSAGAFSAFKNNSHIRTSNLSSSTTHYAKSAIYNSNGFSTYHRKFAEGANTIFVKNATGKSDGTTGIYFGNDGRIYRTVVLIGLEFTADPIAETLYRDKTAIPYLPINADWAADTLGAYCAPNGDPANI